MRLLWCVFIEEPHTRVCCLRIPNRPLAAIFATFQLTVSLTSLFQVRGLKNFGTIQYYLRTKPFQHVFSIYKHRNVFLCRSGISANASIEEKYMAYDVIIFDFGLMHRVLGTEECVANYLDGGYMRFGWCIEQSSALIIAIFSLLCCPKPLWLLWPALLIQSSYSLGLAVLTMATAPKLLEALGGRVDLALTLMFSAYFFG
ncbi:unnamed protein product [Haemonchus placei]|uniref:ABC2_membrane_7 domain-containing protein n=1 Tax=Haemonchus placei TaxID=6290 RepID=A0A158QQ33_HAEPC|nr:unnamed protein product [Haemonchus placei]